MLSVDLLALFRIPNAGLKAVREVKVLVERWHEHSGSLSRRGGR